MLTYGVSGSKFHKIKTREVTAVISVDGNSDGVKVEDVVELYNEDTDTKLTPERLQVRFLRMQSMPYKHIEQRQLYKMGFLSKEELDQKLYNEDIEIQPLSKIVYCEFEVVNDK